MLPLRPPAGPRRPAAGRRRPPARHPARHASAGARRRSRAVIAGLADRQLLWPLLPCHSCATCGLPRRPGAPRRSARAFAAASCARSTAMRSPHSPDLAHHARLAARAELRRFKDDLGAAADAGLARELGAVLSAYLQARLTGAYRPFPAAPLITAVPSTHPVIAAALTRAHARAGGCRRWSTSPPPGRTARASAERPARAAPARPRQVAGHSRAPSTAATCSCSTTSARPAARPTASRSPYAKPAPPRARRRPRAQRRRPGPGSSRASGPPRRRPALASRPVAV